MNEDQVEGKVKDIAGRIERQAGEWTRDTNAQVKGAAKQVEGNSATAMLLSWFGRLSAPRRCERASLALQHFFSPGARLPGGWRQILVSA